MTRLADPAHAARLAQPSVTLCMLAELDFASGIVRVSDYASEISWGGWQWTPLPHATIESAQEDVEAVSFPLRLSVSGDPATIARAVNEIYQGRRATFWLALIDAATGAVIGAPELYWEGRMDVQTIQLDSGAAVLALSCESRLRREPRVARYTTADHQIEHPGGRFFEHAPSISGFVALWGADRMSYSGGAGGVAGGGTPVVRELD